MSKYDILIIGAGPIGMACGIAAKEAGLSYVIIEKGTLVNSLFNYPVFMTFFSTSERLEIGNVPFMSLNNKPNRNEAVEYYRRVKQLFNLNVHLFEEVKTVSRNQQAAERTFDIETSKGWYTAGNVVIATGFYDVPNYMGIPGEDLPKVKHYYKDPHFYAFQKVVVIGASNSAVDVALECWRRGADVTMVVRQEVIGKSVKYWVRPDIENRIKEGSIKAYFQSHVTAVRENEVDIQTPDGLVTIENDWVLAMTGYRPDFKMLERFGIVFSEDEKHCPTYNPETMETNQEGIFLAGVVCGGMDTHKLFIENSRVHATQIIQHIKAQQ
ncbi:YpdA family putative bacillithiol disulfide reductase [Deminuibacter soli]|uniref:YpdA family putative bacillithiol disulfide reductase n=1 Tax=Deminuibacter soli TaxID=2291815 RepID=A0A3E1NLQ3_9BACT|nr:YpdA family putative bacillithiol disulfide reductase [Deminuibacter soli]RFM28870.1 YpdA family putative bacillithiol disulfide reductase [Deminuibacter soli]